MKFTVQDAYETAKPTLEIVVRGFAKRYGGELDELRGEAQVHFLNAFDKYDKSQGKFESWVRFYVWKNLLESTRRRAMQLNPDRIAYRANEYHHYHRLKPGQFELEDVPGPNASPRFNVEAFFCRLSEDAELAAQLVLDTPSHLADQINWHGDRPNNLRKLIRDHLQQACGWTVSRVTQAFNEVQSALA